MDAKTLIDEIGGKLTCDPEVPFTELRELGAVATFTIRPAYSAHLNVQQVIELRDWCSQLLEEV